jgi:hypothetical protein
LNRMMKCYQEVTLTLLETAEKVPLSLIVKRGILKNQNT